MNQSDDIRFLREWASDIRKGGVQSVDADRLEGIARSIEAASTKIANLELELANCKTSRQRAREDILRALDKRLSEDK